MGYQHILVATDLNDECHSVVERAHELSVMCGATLQLIHVIEPMAMAFGGDVPVDLSVLQQQQIDQAKESLASFAKPYTNLTLEQRIIAYGQPRQEIHRVAQEYNIDLIVVGSRSRHGLAILLGSTTKDILHGAPCDVLAVNLDKSTHEDTDTTQ